MIVQNNNKITPICLHFYSAACSSVLLQRQVNKRQAAANAIALLSTVRNMVLEKMCKVFSWPG